MLLAVNSFDKRIVNHLYLYLYLLCCSCLFVSIYKPTGAEPRDAPYDHFEHNIETKLLK